MFGIAIGIIVILSFPAMGTWIEIYPRILGWWLGDCRSLQWERGLKYQSPYNIGSPLCRSLQWERGLKLSFLIPLKTACRRSLQWERGLKYDWGHEISKRRIVVPCNGNVDWNIMDIGYSCQRQSRSLQWERGLKCYCNRLLAKQCRRSLQWERGLKLLQLL